MGTLAALQSYVSNNKPDNDYAKLIHTANTKRWGSEPFQH